MSNRASACDLCPEGKLDRDWYMARCSDFSNGGFLPESLHKAPCLSVVGTLYFQNASLTKLQATYKHQEPRHVRE